MALRVSLVLNAFLQGLVQPGVSADLSVQLELSGVGGFVQVEVAGMVKFVDEQCGWVA